MLTAQVVADTCLLAAYRVTAIDETLGFVTAERDIPGHRHHVRAAVFQRFTEGIWTGSLFHRFPTAQIPVTFRSVPLVKSNLLSDVDALGLWLGGASSKPVDQIEVHAILNSPAAA